ncbi:MAG: hypothetical protein RL129_774 [Actinomycetota bacterium]|jgi:phage terminase large subunit-like protein
MTKPDQVIIGARPKQNALNRQQAVLESQPEMMLGEPMPRIHTPLNDAPSRGQELIDFADRLFEHGFMQWQKNLAIHSCKVKPDGRWLHPIFNATVARQNGKSTYMNARILMGLFEWDEPLQILSSHRLQTSLERFRELVGMIEQQDELAKQVKRIRWAHGSEEIEALNGNRLVLKAGGAAARGMARPSTIYLDELREMRDMESFASLRYSMMASPNPQLLTFTNAGDATSLVLNSFRERALAAAAGAKDDIGYFEWSAPTDDVSLENARYSNPALGITIHPDNLNAVFNDPPDVVQTEVLCRWVQTINSVIDTNAWSKCVDKSVDLDTEKLTWLAVDMSPDRRFAALVGAQKLGKEQFIVKLLHTWENDLQLDDKAIANETADYCRKYPIEYLLYSRRTSGAVAARMQPAGIPIFDMDSSYPQSCDELVGAINSGRLKHRGQEELTKQMLSAVALKRNDGWIIGRRASGSAVCAAVATALATHFATRPEIEIDILSV